MDKKTKQAKKSSKLNIDSQILQSIRDKEIEKPVIQTQKNGKIVAAKKKHIYSTFDVQEDMYNKFRVKCAEKRITHKEFFIKTIEQALDDKITFPIQNYDPFDKKEAFKVSLYIPEELNVKFKQWIAINRVHNKGIKFNMKTIMIYSINLFLDNKNLLNQEYKN